MANALAGLYSIIRLEVVWSKLIDKWLRLQCHFCMGNPVLIFTTSTCIFTHKMLTKHNIEKLFSHMASLSVTLQQWNVRYWKICNFLKWPSFNVCNKLKLNAVWWAWLTVYKDFLKEQVYDLIRFMCTHCVMSIKECHCYILWSAM